MAYGIGLDCGTTSVGFAVVELDSNDEPRRIIRLGSRIFTAAENPKDGSSLAAPRREKRSMRRRLRRHKHRNERIRHLLVESGIVTETELSELFIGNLTDIYELRTKGLDTILNREEFVRVLLHLAQRRGFKSQRKNPADDKEAGLLLNAVSENARLMTEKGYRTVGEMLYLDDKFSQYKRNKGANYTNTVSRDMVEAEIHALFSTQRSFSNPVATQQLEEAYTAIVLSQRSFEDGPGGNSKYGGNQIEKMMGACTLIPDERRAAKATYSFQLFTLLQKIGTIRILNNGESRELTAEERKIIVDLAHEKATLKFSDIRKKLGLSESDKFNLLNYSNGVAEAEKKPFNYLKAYHEIRKVLDKIGKGRIRYLSKDCLNQIGYIFTVYKNDDSIKAALDALELEPQDKEQLLTLGNFSKFGHLSVKACDLLIPYLEQGLNYSDSCETAGLSFKAHGGKKSKYLPGYAPELADLNNPVVKRAVSQTIKVVNAIVREQGESPVFINIELAREMSRTFDERNKDTKLMEENRKRNEAVMERLRFEFRLVNPTGMDLVKLKLWEEQDGISPYSQKHIEISRLFEQGYAEVDHIFPYSISFDDSYKNKVLVLAEENRNKGNRLPLQYLSSKRREDYIVWVNTNVKNYRKKQLLLKESFSAADRENLKQRSLQDTQYLSRFLYNYINDHMDFAPFTTGKKRHITTVNGAVTSYVRKRWGIAKIREDGDLHHAADAVVIACITNGMINRISSYSNYHETVYSEATEESGGMAINSKTGEVMDSFPYPWPTFRKELEIRLSNDPQSILSDIILPNYTAEEQEAVTPCFVSRMPTRKTKGPAHKDTIRSPKALDDGLVISKVSLSKLKIKNGEIENYYNPESDRLLYNALKERLMQFDGNGEKAFTEPFYKPTSTGQQGPLVKSVKLCEKSTLNVPVHDKKGVADNDSMVRVDVFCVENDGFYLVPIYVADTVKKELPNKAIVAGKPYSEWKEMDDKNFIFSLYPNDLVLAESKKPIKLTLSFKDSSLPKEHLCQNELLYFKKACISTGSITVATHDNSYSMPSLGVKTLRSLAKYEVDTLGNYHPVGQETRKNFR